jgi:hypothetical protein
LDEPELLPTEKYHLQPKQNINLETDNNIAGKSLISAIAAPKTIATPNHDGNT